MPRHTQVKLAACCVLAAGSLAAQAPRIGAVEFYGFNKVPVEKARQALGVAAGDRLPGSKGDLEDRLESIPGVVEARVEAVCCERDQVALFAGIEERGGPHFSFRSVPGAEVTLPGKMEEDSRALIAASEAAARRGSTAEDLTRGHSLMADPAARALQEGFAGFAAENVPLLRNVLLNAADPDQRAMAATIVGYAPDKKAVLNDLQAAMQDPEEPVRANAMTALSAIAVLATREPSLEIRIPATWFVEMLNSIVLSDRTRAAAALVNLTELDRGGLAQIRERALRSVTGMARWQTLRYALPPYILAGRIAGLSEKEIQDAWSAGRRETVIQRAEKMETGK